MRNLYGGVAGVVSETDLLRKEEYQRAGKHWLHRTARTKADALTAGALMTRPAITVEGGCTLDEAARLMAAHRITRLVAKRSTVAFAETLIAGVDGVVGVRNELTWAFDDTAPAAGTAGPFY
ncbi:CBS domain-containing protein [Kribbella sp. NPDC026596]|uniref:CBS domain-containing protein n=1 Tax=Kribbella sp. NPDC026596 TaxID=3155122 RepID=UPI0033CD4227